MGIRKTEFRSTDVISGGCGLEALHVETVINYELKINAQRVVILLKSHSRQKKGKQTNKNLGLICHCRYFLTCQYGSVFYSLVFIFEAYV